MTTDRQPTAFARAEFGARQLVLQLGLGSVSFVIGSLLASGLLTRLADRLPTLEGEGALFAQRWVVQRLWLFAVLPAFAWVVGRFSGQSLVAFALVAGLFGEFFGILLATAIDGLEALASSRADVAARLVTLFFGLWLTHRAGLSGRAEGALDEAEALAEAERRKAEYEGYLDALERRPAGGAAAGEGGPPATPGAPT